MSKRVLNLALKKWGPKSQLEMALEESIELSLALRKYLRNPCDKSYVN